LRSESKSRLEYLIPTNNIIVLDSYFNSTKKSNFIDSLRYDLIRFFDLLVVAYFFGLPCIAVAQQLTSNDLIPKQWKSRLPFAGHVFS